MTQAFHFEDSGRTFSCGVEAPRGARTEAWWWFGVSGDAHRYAPFPALPGDTQDEVRQRIVAYYTDLLYRRAQPPVARQHWAHRAKAAAPAAPAAEATTTP